MTPAPRDAIDLRLATEPDLPVLLPMVAEYHQFEAIDSSAAGRESALRRLLAAPEFGAVWLVRVDDAMAGYIALCRGFSIEFDGFDAFIDEFFLLPGYRGRGVGSRVLELIRNEARRLDINALHLEVARDNEAARRLYRRAGFEAREKYLLMTALLERAD